MTTMQRGVRTTWAIDPTHAAAEFAVKHLMISTVKGQLGKVQGTISLDESDYTNSSVEATIDVAGLDTGEPDRDKHLRSPDFFEAERFPIIRFVSKRIERAKGDDYRIVGDLTIRDVTREATLEAELDGRITDPWGKERLGFSADTKFRRKDFGLEWNMALEAGGVLVGDEVKVSLRLEAVRQD